MLGDFRVVLEVTLVAKLRIGALGKGEPLVKPGRFFPEMVQAPFAAR